MQPYRSSSDFHSYNTIPRPSASTTVRTQTKCSLNAAELSESASRGSWYSKDAPLKSKEALPPSSGKTRKSKRSSETSITLAHTSIENRVSSAFNLITAEESRQLWSIRSSFSRSELSFIGCAESFGLKTAMRLADGFHWEFGRVLSALEDIRALSSRCGIQDGNVPGD
jgi:hypothetical protein